MSVSENECIEFCKAYIRSDRGRIIVRLGKHCNNLFGITNLENGRIEIDGDKLRIVGNRVWYDYLGGLEDYTRLTDERKETYIIDEKDIVYKKEWIWFGKEEPWIPRGYYILKKTCTFDAEYCGNFTVIR